MYLLQESCVDVWDMVPKGDAQNAKRSSFLGNVLETK